MQGIEEWATELAHKKAEKRESENAKCEKILSDRKLIKARADSMWTELRRSVISHVENLCRAMDGEEVVTLDTANPQRMAIRPSEDSRELFVFAFDPESCMVNTTGLNYRLIVSDVNEVMWEDEKTHTRFQSEIIARLGVERAFRQTK